MNHWNTYIQLQLLYHQNWNCRNSIGTMQTLLLLANRQLLLAENLPNYFSKVPTYSVRTLLLVLQTLAGGGGRREEFVVAATYLTNDRVKCVVDKVMQSGRRLKERTIPPTGQHFTFLLLHLYTQNHKQVRLRRNLWTESLSSIFT